MGMVLERALTGQSPHDRLGDDIYALARKYNTTVDLLQRYLDRSAGDSKPLDRTILLDGHSFIANGFAGTAYRRRPVDFGYWIQLLTEWAVSSPYTLNLGVSGQTSTEILSRISATLTKLAHTAAILTPSLGVNNVGGADISLNQTIADIRSYASQIIATGKPYIYFAITPRTGLDLVHQQRLEAIRQFELTTLAAMAPNQLFVVDVWDQVVDVDGKSLRTDMSADGTHPVPKMARLMVKNALWILNAIFPAYDPVAAILAGKTNLVTANLTGITGTHSGSGTFTGTVPTGIAQSHPGGANLSVTAAAEQVLGGIYYNVQQTYNGATALSGGETLIPMSATPFADGDYIRIGVRLKIRSLVGQLAGMFAGMRVGTSGTTFLWADGYKFSDTVFYDMRPFGGLMMSEPIKVAGLGASAPNFIIRPDFGISNTVNTSVNYDISSPFVVKL